MENTSVTASSGILLPLARLRRRMVGQCFIERAGIIVLICSALFLIVAVANSFRGIPPIDIRVFLGFISTAFFLSALWTWISRPSFRKVAIRIDSIAATNDRFLTAYDFSQKSAPSGLQQSAMRECIDFVSGFDIRAHTKFRFPVVLPWLMVPLLALGLLEWNFRLSHKVEEATVPHIADKEVAGLEEIAKTVEISPSKELQELAAEIRESEKKMRGADSAEARKAALREMSVLESKMKEMLGKSFSDEEMAVLASALKQSELTKKAGDELAAGKKADAAAALEQILKQKQEGSQMAEVREALLKAMSGISPEKRGELGRQVEQSMQAGEGNQSTGAQALQRLAESLRKAADSEQQQSPSQNANNREAIRNALAALQNMKYGNQQGRDMGDSRQGNGNSGALTQMTEGNGRQSPGSTPTGLSPGGPGSEHDTGTTDRPTGAAQTPRESKGQVSRVDTQMGEGDSLHDFISSTGDTSKAKRSYNDLYNAMLPAAEDAVTQENIPLGSRFYIKRYFESIRPKN